MPDDPMPKSRPHPKHATARDGDGSHRERHAPSMAKYAELHVTSNFTFLTGASHPDELVTRAAELGHQAIAITDCNTLAGMVRAHVAAKDAGIQLVVGCRLDCCDVAGGQSVLVYPTDRASYGRLCRLLTLGKRRAGKGECRLSLQDLGEHAAGLLAVVVPPADVGDGFVNRVRDLSEVFDDDRLSLAAVHHATQDAATRLELLADVAVKAKVPLVATNDVHYHDPARRRLQDVLTCIRHGCTIDRAGFRLLAHAERHLKPPDEMHRLFAPHPRAVARTLEIAQRARGFSLDHLRYEYPDEVVPHGATPMSHLAAVTWAGAAARYPAGVPERVRRIVEHELRLIEELEYPAYFLTVYELVAFARGRGILCQGRGAAANSAVCYCLGVTSVDPDRSEMLFERFISKERNEPPDIDIDFEHERREEVIQHLYAKYGRDRAALTAEVISYRGKSAIRDVGKAMGLSLDCVGRLSKELSWWDAGTPSPQRVRELGLDPKDRTIAATLALAGELIGFPRHLSQHVGGFIITRSPLCELVPIENAAMADRTVVEWDKDDVDALGMLKVDCLGLGMLTCLRKCMGLIEQHEERAYTLATIPAEDRATYDMICKADTVGVFQIESRAQMSMLPRLRPRCFYDLVIEVAIVRPGPIQGKMVHPYLARRASGESVAYASPEVERVLGRTLGVPLFQEQAMSLAVVAAGFTPGEADQLRRAMAAWKRSGKAILRFERKLIDGMLARGHTREFATQTFQQITGFSGYGFPESHAASFALLVYASCYLKCHHPAAFTAALLNSQPMGFYQPAQIVRDARSHGVEVRPVDVNASAWDCTLEPTPTGLAVRLGMRLVMGMREADAHRMHAARTQRGAFTTPTALLRASAVSVAALRTLARADAFASMGLSRQQALWSLEAMDDAELPLFAASSGAACEAPVAHVHLPSVTASAEVTSDYRATGLSLKNHPVAFVRDLLDAQHVTRARDLSDERTVATGARIAVAGMVTVRQRPSTASGIVFLTIEDETGVANIIVRPKVFDRYRKAARHAPLIICTGSIERAGQVVHLIARTIRTLPTDHAKALVQSRDFH